MDTAIINKILDINPTGLGSAYNPELNNKYYVFSSAAQKI